MPNRSYAAAMKLARDTFTGKPSPPAPLAAPLAAPLLAPLAAPSAGWSG